MKVFDFDPRDNSTRNYIINGNFDFWQRGTSATRTPASSPNGYLADRMQSGVSIGGGASKSITVARAAVVPSGLTVPANYSMQITNNFAQSLAAADSYYPLLTFLEANIAAQLSGGYVTLGFYAYNDVNRTFSVAFNDGAASQSYVTTLSGVAGWSYYTVSVLLNAFTITPSASAGLRIIIGSIGGTGSQAPSLNSWISGNYYVASTADNWASSTGVKMRFAQIQLRQGAVSADDMQKSFSLFGGTYDNELRACQRYYWKSYDVDTAPGSVNVFEGAIGSQDITVSAGGSNAFYIPLVFPVRMRGSPVVSMYNPSSGAINSIRNSSGVANVNFSSVSIGSGQGGIVSTQINTASAGITYGQACQFHFTADADF